MRPNHKLDTRAPDGEVSWATNTTSEVLRAASRAGLAERRMQNGPGELCPWLHAQTDGLTKSVDRIRVKQLEREKGVSFRCQTEQEARRKRREERRLAAAEARKAPPPLPVEPNEWWEGRYVGRETEYAEAEQKQREASGAAPLQYVRPSEARFAQQRVSQPKRIEAYTTKMQSTDAAGQQLLHAVENANIAQVQELAKDYRCDVNVQPSGREGATAAHVLAAALIMPPGRKVELAKVLMRMGARTGALIVNDGGMGAHQVALRTSESLCQTITVPGPSGPRRRLASSCCGLCGRDLDRAREEAIECAHVLNPSSIWRAALDGDLEHLRWLAERKYIAVVGDCARNVAEPASARMGGAAFVPLHYAALAGRVRVCRYLLELGESPSRRAHDRRGTTAHHLAAERLRDAKAREYAAKQAISQFLATAERRHTARDEKRARAYTARLDARKAATKTRSERAVDAAEAELRAAEQYHGRLVRAMEHGTDRSDGGTATSVADAEVLVKLLQQYDGGASAAVRPSTANVCLPPHLTARPVSPARSISPTRPISPALSVSLPTPRELSQAASAWQRLQGRVTSRADADADAAAASTSSQRASRRFAARAAAAVVGSGAGSPRTPSFGTAAHVMAELGGAGTAPSVTSVAFDTWGDMVGGRGGRPAMVPQRGAAAKRGNLVQSLLARPGTAASC